MGGEQSRQRRRNDHDDRRGRRYDDDIDRDLESGKRRGSHEPDSSKYSMYEKRDRLEKEKKHRAEDEESVKSHRTSKSRLGHMSLPGSKANSVKGKHHEKEPSAKPEEEKPPLNEVDMGMIVQSERKVLDVSSSTLHRAAAHGDYAVLEAMLNSPDTHVGEVDNKMRTAMHVAAYRGKHAALIMLSAKASKADLFARDHTSRTAFEILMEFHDSNMAASATATNDLVEQCEADRDMHKLCSRCYGSLNFYLFFLPVALILTLCSILSYVASAESNREVFNADVGAGVGCLCGFCVFSIAIQEILGLSTLAMFHKTAEKELIDLVDELEFSSVDEYVSDVLDGGLRNSQGNAGRPNAALVKKQLQQITASCKAEVPAQIKQLFMAVKVRVDHELLSVMQLDKGGHRYLTLKSIAYNAARIAVTGAATWPFFLPNPRHTAKYVLKKVVKVATSTRLDKDGHRMQLDSDDDWSASGDESESDEEYPDADRCCLTNKGEAHLKDQQQGCWARCCCRDKNASSSSSSKAKPMNSPANQQRNPAITKETTKGVAGAIDGGMGLNDSLDDFSDDDEFAEESAPAPIRKKPMPPPPPRSASNNSSSGGGPGPSSGAGPSGSSSGGGKGGKGAGKGSGKGGKGKGGKGPSPRDPRGGSADRPPPAGGDGY